MERFVTRHSSLGIRHSSFVIVLILAVGLLGVSVQTWAAEPVTLKSVTLDRSVIALSERCELTVQIEGPIRNPYDPEEVALEAVFQPPSGNPITVPGFYYQPFEWKKDGGNDQLVPVGQPVWKVRFTPRKTGLWSYEVKLTTPRGTQSIAGKGLEVGRSTRRGFLQFDKTSGYFKFDQGQTFIPIGENLAWPPAHHALRTYEAWFQDLIQQRANYIRVWLAPWAFRLETPETGVGRYDQARAWQVDYLLERSEELGLYWQLVLFEHGSFSRTQDPEWSHNPYNEQLGGMCRLPADFITHPMAKMMCQRLLRYLVARYGYSPALVSWELFNEIDLSEIPFEPVPAWASQMSKTLKTLDPNARPVTMSFHKTNVEVMWQSPALDWIQLHRYDERDFAQVFCDTPMITRPLQEFHKPVLVGEFGWITEFMRRVDVYGIHLHDGLWSSLMAGSVGGALIWYWDSYVHPNHLERHFRPLAMFWRGEQITERLKRLDVSLSDPDLLGCGVGTTQRAYLWFKNRTHNVDQYLAYRAELAKQALRQARGQTPKVVTYPPKKIAHATATLRGFGSGGNYRVEWWNPYTGEIMTTAMARARGGVLTLEIPAVLFDVAAKVMKLRWWEKS